MIFSESPFGLELLFKAVQSGEPIHVQAVLDKYPQALNQKNALGDTPFMLAAALGLESVVDFLIEKKARTGMSNLGGDTAAHLAARNGFFEICQKIMDSNSLVRHQPNANNETPFGLMQSNNSTLKSSILLFKR